MTSAFTNVRHLRSRLPDPMTAPGLGWAVLGPGRIATSFVASLAAHTRQRLAAIGSRRYGRSEAFARRYGDTDTRAYGSYTEAIDDPGVDVVYIAVPHPFHAPLAHEAITAGKAVLVEKPFALSEAEAQSVAVAAHEADVFAAEAMWPRFLPAYDVLRQVLQGRLLGDIHSVVADLGEHFEPDPRGRLFDPALGGGARLDLGVYLASFASLVGGETAECTARATYTATGVDATFTAALHSVTGVDSTLYCTLRAPTPTRAWIGGSEATLTVAAPFYAPPAITIADVRRQWEKTILFTQTSPLTGLAWEAAHVARSVVDGLTESPLLTLRESVGIAHTLDAIATQFAAYDAE